MNKIKNDKLSLRIGFFGTPEFSNILLKALVKAGHLPVVIVTKPDALVGRKKILTSSIVKQNAQSLNIPTLTPKKLDADFFSLYSSFQTDIAIVCAYGKIFPKELLSLPKKGCLNIHASLLPFYRGASPIQNAILDGKTETGITLMIMEPGLDTGPILKSKSILIEKNDTTETLTPKLAYLGSELVLEILPDWIKNCIEPKKQDDKLATYCKIIHKEDGHINWNQTADSVYNTFRAFTPWPGIHAFLKIKDKSLRIKFLDITTDSITIHSNPPGTIQQFEKKLFVVTGDRKSIIIKKIQVEGKNPISSDLFLSGYRNTLNTLLF
ncbi:MAG: methionyl-tRNA formyltransferase [Candidatus Moraniibacteriota bacterium]|nr:MAG: methionyl-tRNA formyltransferase [Candidatus Moranbacteria bacterium]